MRSVATGDQIGKKHAILVAGEELLRARGGPRGMTMPRQRAR